MYEPYTCPNCQGELKVPCDCCGQEADCDVCHATGLDPELVDLPRWIEAERKFQRKHLTTGGRFEAGKFIGREALRSGERLLITDYLRLEVYQ